MPSEHNIISYLDFVLKYWLYLRRSAHREKACIKVKQSHKHEDQKDSASQLHVLLGWAFSHRGNSSKHTPAFRTRLGQQQQQTSTQCQIPVNIKEEKTMTSSEQYNREDDHIRSSPHQKFRVPKNAIGYRLEEMETRYSDCNLNWNMLTKEIKLSSHLQSDDTE